MALEQARPFAERFVHFVNKTGSPYHSVQAVRELLTCAGFEELPERERWKMQKGGKYFITRNGSCIAAFVVGRDFNTTRGGFCVTATHTDSPCLRLRPRAFFEKEGYHMGNVECYGSGLWHTWFDRGLGMAGKVVLRKGNKVVERLLRIARPIFYLPNMAIHLQTAEEIAAFKINKELHLQPVLCSEVAEQERESEKTEKEKTEKEKKEKEKKEKGTPRLPPALGRLIGQTLGLSGSPVLDWDLCLLDSSPGRVCGVYEEFIESARLDNQISTFAAFNALINVGEKQEKGEMFAGTEDVMMAVAFDHEEVGSVSYAGANSSILETLMRRTLLEFNSQDNFYQIIERSFIVSSDMAHAVHPNYPDKHQAQHKPTMHGGVVIKENANQNYASNAATMPFIRVIAEDAKIPLQDFVVRNDSRCGGTVGAMLSARLGVRTVDIGIPQWAMHSCREICGVTDLMYLQKLLEAVYCNFRKWDADE